MENKKCSKCGLDKTADNFYPRSDKPHLLQSQCKSCQSPAITKKCEYCGNDFKAKKSQKFCDEHKGRICTSCKKLMPERTGGACNECENDRSTKYHQRKKQENPAYHKELYEKNSERIRAQRKKYYEKGKANRKPATKEYNKQKYLKNKKRVLASSREWIKNNKQRHEELCRKSSAKFRKEKPHVIAWRNSLHRVLRQFNTAKKESTHKLLGYSAIELKNHLQALFTEGMSWDNFGEWHIDHKRSVCTFPKDTPVSVVNALNNLQPLWKLDNLKKPKK